MSTEDLLEGEVDIAAILRTAAAAGYEGWLALELWHPGGLQPLRSMTEDTKRSVDYLRGLI